MLLAHPDTLLNEHSHRSGTFIVRDVEKGTRLDYWLSIQPIGLSRSRWQQLIKSGQVLLNAARCSPRDLVHPADQIQFHLPAPEPIDLQPEPIPLSILFEDAELIVINKPPDLVVHPAPGHASGTVVQGLLYHCQEYASFYKHVSLGTTPIEMTSSIGGQVRPGIIHRLDKDTSGVLVVAKNDRAMASLSQQFKSRKVIKQYAALVHGHPSPTKGTIETLIGRSQKDRKKMSTKPRSGKKAITHYEIIESFQHAAFLRIFIETGRTHQIRVHMTHIGHPLLGDQQYGKRSSTSPHFNTLTRQMLHAEQLTITHPRTHDMLEFTAPFPEDMLQVLQQLRAS